MARRSPDVLEPVRISARAGARDLVRLLGVLSDMDLEVETDTVEALDRVGQDLAGALTAGPGTDAETLARDVAGARARLATLRRAVLDAAPGRRSEVVRALLAYEVKDEDLEVERVPSAPTKKDLERAEARVLRRLEVVRAGDIMRRRVEARLVDGDGSAAALYARLPAPWLRAAWREARGRGRPASAALAEKLQRPRTLRGLVLRLRPGERRVLDWLLGHGGIVPARDLEARVGDAQGDGYHWDRFPPTSVLGRLMARGLVVVGRVEPPRARGGKPPKTRRAPRVVLVPRDLRAPLARVLSAVLDEAVASTVPEDVVGHIAGLEQEAGEEEVVRFERAQPELSAFSAAAAAALAAPVGPATLFYFVERIWAMYEAAHPERVPRLRKADIETARSASEKELGGIEGMHERLLMRRVGTLISNQPYLYGFLAHGLEDETLPLPEGDKAIVFHACDTAIRAFDRVLGE